MRINIIVLLIFCVHISVRVRSESDSVEYDSEEFIYGEPINVLNVTEKNEFAVDVGGINKIFLRSDLKDRKIVAVSIVGIFRKGKSFLLNYFLRYLYGNFKSVNYPNNPLNNTEGWLGNAKEPLLGFLWRPSVERVTNGIIMWSDVFIYDTVAGEKLAIVLIDTQGLFDQRTSPSVNSKMFALTTLISSVQIYNLHNVVQEDQLQYLQFTSDFTKLINNIDLDAELEDSSNEKPFQKIILLMRDWVNNAEYPFGLKGGEKYLNDVLEITNEHEKDAREVRKFVRSSFESISCFLMPHPGNKMFSNKHFEGEWSELDEKFVESLKNLTSWLFDPSNLFIKKTFTDFVTAEEYAEHLKFYFEAASSNEIMNVTSIFESSIESEINIILQKSLKIFRKDLVDSENFEKSTFLNELDNIGKTTQNNIIKYFKESIKPFFENDKLLQKRVGRLQDLTTKELDAWKTENADNERSKIEGKLNSTLKTFEIEKIKIEEEREAERQRILKEKLKDLENARKECENIVMNTKKSYTSEMEEIKQREMKLKEQKTKLENERREQEAALRKKIEEDRRNHEIEVQKLKSASSKMESDLKKKSEETERRLKLQHDKIMTSMKLDLEEYKLKQKLKDLENQAEMIIFIPRFSYN